VVGIVDYGCDFAHKNFQSTSGTRIEAIWHQGGADTHDAPFGYGALYERAAIDAALKQPAPYSTLGYGPARDTPHSQGTHGTHVMDIAAGNGGGSSVPGFAPEASIIFVDVSSEDIPWQGPDVVTTSFGDSVRLLEAVRFIFDRAGTRPCVVNISLGTNGGPHDGTTLVERGLDRLVEEESNRAVVIAASNSYSDQIHAAGTVVPGASVEIKWNRPPSTGWQDELDIWYAGADRIAVELLMPDGTSAGIVEPGETGEAQESGKVVLLIASRLNDPNNGDNNIGIFIDDSLPTGVWTLRLIGRTVTNGRFNAWIERDDTSQASFLDNIEPDGTIGSISCGRHSLVAASYDAHKSGTPLSWFSSAGPTRDGRQKPEIAAPGHAVAAAHSRTSTGIVIKSGTSMAAPAVTGTVALLLAEAAARGIDLDIGRIRTLVTNNLARAPGVQGWNSRWGGGMLDAAAAMAALPRRRPPGAGTARLESSGSSAARAAKSGGPTRGRATATGRKGPRPRPSKKK
jgi:subtilisin family serine protease